MEKVESVEAIKAKLQLIEKIIGEIMYLGKDIKSPILKKVIGELAADFIMKKDIDFNGAFLEFLNES